MIIIAIMAFVFVWMLIYMQTRSRRVQSRLDSIHSILGNFKDDYVSDRLNALDYAKKKCEIVVSKRAWLEFDQSLVAVSHKTDSGKELRSSVPSSEYFNTENLAGEILHNRILNLGPGFFTALGVLGTFFGLTTGLAGLEVGDSASIDELRNGIHALIDGAATAFYTSLGGIFLSLVSSAAKGWKERQLIRTILRLQTEIDDKFPRYSPEQALANIATNTLESSSSLQNLHERIGDRFQASVQSLASDMQEAVAAAITAALAPAMNNLSTSMSEQSNSVFEELVGKFASSFENIGNTQAQQLSSASDELNRSVNVVADEFSSMLSAFSEQQTQNQKAASESNENFKGQMEQLLALVDDQRSESSRTMEDLRSTLTTVSASLDSSSGNLISVASTFKEASAQASGDVVTTTGHLSTAAAHVTTAAQHQSKAIELLADHRDQAMVLQQQLRELSVHLDNAVGKSAETFGALGQQQDIFLGSLKQNVREVNQSLQDSVASITSSMDKWLQDYAQSVSSQTAERMNDWNLHSQEYARHMLQVASALESVMDEMPKARS